MATIGLNKFPANSSWLYVHIFFCVDNISFSDDILEQAKKAEEKTLWSTQYFTELNFYFSSILENNNKM